jgi:hypothetical protein
MQSSTDAGTYALLESQLDRHMRIVTPIALPSARLLRGEWTAATGIAVRYT